MRLSRILFFTIKQALKRPVMWFLLLIMPVICFAIHTISIGDEHTHITALFYVDRANNEPIYDALTNYEGLIEFEYVDSKDEVLSKINLSQAECGYIFKDDALEQLYKGTKGKQIEVISKNGSSMSLVIDEILYSQLFPIISKNAVTTYLTTKGASKEYYNDLFTSSDISELYDKYYSNGSTFHFDYDGAPEDYSLTPDQIIIAPMRGLLALFIFIASFAGSLQFYKQAENPVFSLNKIRIVHIFIPTLLTAISSYISLIASKAITEKYLTEALILILYVLIVTVFSFTFTKLVKKENVLGWILPFIIIGSLIFTPVIIDISAFIPLVKYLSFLFPTKYYLALLALI